MRINMPHADSFTLAALLMIVSGSLHAVVNAIVKGGRDKAAGRAMTDAASALVLLPAVPFVPLPHGAWGWLALSAAVHVVYLYAMIRAYALADFSACYPVLRGSAPLVTAAIMIGVVGEPASAAVIAGIGCIGGAMFLLVSGRHLGRAALGWSLLTGSMTAAYTVADAHGVRAAPSVASYIVWDFVLLGFLCTGMFALLTRGRVFSAMRAQWRPGTIAGLLSIGTYGLALTAYALGPTAPLAALRETGMVTALLIAIVFLREPARPAVAVAVLGILAGAALILTG